jgi:hypothetical protein
MAIETYQGESHRILVEIKNGSNNVLNPGDAGISDLRVYIVHRVSNEVIAKFGKVAQTGYTLLTTVEEPDPADYKAQCIFNASQSQESQQGMYEIQIDMDIPDERFEGQVKTFRQKGILMNLNPAVNGL